MSYIVDVGVYDDMDVDGDVHVGVYVYVGVGGVVDG